MHTHNCKGKKDGTLVIPIFNESKYFLELWFSWGVGGWQEEITISSAFCSSYSPTASS